MGSLTATKGANQRLEALERANAARWRELEVRREASALPRWEGALLIARLLVEDPGDRIAKSRVHAILEAAPWIGEDKARIILQRHQIWPLRRVRDLTLRQRSLLSDELARHAAGLRGREAS